MQSFPIDARRGKAVLGMASMSLLVFVAGGILAAGCGSGGGTTTVSSAGTTTTASTFAGRAYQSTVALAEGQTGTLNLSLASTGNQATGTLTIDDGVIARGVKSRAVITTSFLSGTFDPVTGAIHLSGSYTINGQTHTISLTCSLPTPPSTTGGSVSLTIDGTTYTSTFGGAIGATPTPSPTASATASTSPSASPTPTPSASPTAAPSPGVVNQITITGGTTNQLHALTTTNSIGASTFSNAPVTGGGLIIFNLKNGASDSADEASLEVDIKTGATLAPGTYPVVGPSGVNGPASGATSVSYSEFSGGFRNYQAQPAKGLSGQVIVEQVSPTLVRVRLVDVRVDRFAPLSTVVDTLTLNGTLETSAVLVVN